MRCRHCRAPIVPDAGYEGGWAHETPVPGHDADICAEILTAAPDQQGVVIDFDPDELLGIALAMKATGETFVEFIERAIAEAAKRVD